MQHKEEVCQYSSCFPSSSLLGLTPCSLSCLCGFCMCWFLKHGSHSLLSHVLKLVIHCPRCHLFHDSFLSLPRRILWSFSCIPSALTISLYLHQIPLGCVLLWRRTLLPILYHFCVPNALNQSLVNDCWLCLLWNKEVILGGGERKEDKRVWVS